MSKSVADLLAELEQAAPDESKLDTLKLPHDTLLHDPALPCAPEEIVVEGGNVRQAGTVDPPQPDGLIDACREKFERSLYAFTKSVMGMDRMTNHLHLPICDWLGTQLPRHKGLLIPRNHLKSSIVARCLGPHMLIQPAANNIYFPGCHDVLCRSEREVTGGECPNPEHLFDGCDTRILLGYETLANAKQHLRWVEGQWDGNELLRSFWPDRVWETSGRHDAPVWNQEQMQIPRSKEFSEASIETFGVEGAVTGRHYAVLLFDDLCTEKAANSAVEMQNCIDWYDSKRAILDDQLTGLEYLIGTKWATWDLYSHVRKTDPTFEWRVRSVVEDGKPIFPEMFPPKVIEELRKKHGALFPLIYMNNAYDPELVDFDIEEVRPYALSGMNIVFEEAPADQMLYDKVHIPAAPVNSPLQGEFLPLKEYVERAHPERTSGNRDIIAERFNQYEREEF